MTVAKKQISYLDWLKTLKAGDKVKVYNYPKVVIGVTDTEILVKHETEIGYYSRANGRELGSRPGTYKQRSISIYSDDERKRDEEKKITEKLKQDKKDKYDEMYQLIDSRNMPLSKIEAMIKLLKEVNKKKFVSEDWETK